MLVSFEVENWMSFRDKANFSMLASRERQHGERIPRVNRYRIRVLPIAMIYGGNAAGKTNLFQAINFARDLVVAGTQPGKLIAVRPFRLDATTVERPSSFRFEILVGDVLFEFAFTVTRKKVLEERLIQINSSTETVLYHRLNGAPNFDNSLEDDQHLRFAFKGTRDNQLFLTNSISQDIDKFRPVYDWFRRSLNLIAPDSRFADLHDFVAEGGPHTETINRALEQLDTGIRGLSEEEIPLSAARLPAELEKKLESDVGESDAVLLIQAPAAQRIVVLRRNGELVAKRLRTRHESRDGTLVEFEMYEESDGSQRVIDLLPAFLDLTSSGSDSVYIVDELDRSLHPLLTRQLIEFHLGSCGPESRAQLIATTHDLLLMDQHLLRRDEMWVAERTSSGASRIHSFSDFEDVRYDKDLRKSYLKGRLGGVPRIHFLPNPPLKSGVRKAGANDK